MCNGEFPFLVVPLTFTFMLNSSSMRVSSGVGVCSVAKWRTAKWSAESPVSDVTPGSDPALANTLTDSISINPQR